MKLPAVGDAVRAGDALVVVEAMKMEHVLRAGITGVVESVHVAENDLVGDRDVLVTLRAADGNE